MAQRLVESKRFPPIEDTLLEEGWGSARSADASVSEEDEGSFDAFNVSEEEHSAAANVAGGRPVSACD